MKRSYLAAAVCSVLMSIGMALSAGAAFQPDVEKAYNMAVQGQDALDGLDVTVKETITSAETNLSSDKNVTLQVTGIRQAGLTADIVVTTAEGRMENYYRNNYYYTTTSKGKIRQSMDRGDIWQKINSHIYLDMTSNYLKMLSSAKETDGTVTFHFAATDETLGDYSGKLLAGMAEGQGTIESLVGTMKTDREGHVLERTINMVYTIGEGDHAETFLMEADAVFSQDGEVKVSLPDLSAYREPEEDRPAVTITPLFRTVYVTADVNVRAAGDVSAAILGSFGLGSGVTQTGYTSDGWVQIQYNEGTGYIWGGYVSTIRPVITKNSSGTMYATISSNVRESYSTDSRILGVLSKGESITITGTTSNGWTRVNYQGRTAYISSNLLSWSEPVIETYVQSGTMYGYVEEAVFDALVIRGTDGKMTVFNTTYASVQVEDTMEKGDYVTVEYTGSAIPYTATKVIDNQIHEDNGTKIAYSVVGVILEIDGMKYQLSCNDGVVRSFDLSEADIEMITTPVVGDYVTVTWMSAKGGKEKKNIRALRMM